MVWEPFLVRSSRHLAIQRSDCEKKFTKYQSGTEVLSCFVIELLHSYPLLIVVVLSSRNVLSYHEVQEDSTKS